MTASVPKQDPDTERVQQNAYNDIRTQTHNLQIVGVIIPFAKLQNDTKTTVKQWKTSEISQNFCNSHKNVHFQNVLKSQTF